MTNAGWGRAFDARRLAHLELRMWKAYYRRQPVRLFGLLILANREQARVGWIRAVVAAAWLARGAARFGRSTGDYDRFLPDVVRGYRALGLPDGVDAAGVARQELRWWVVRREIGLTAGEAAGEAIAAVYAALYGLPGAAVAEAGRLRGRAAEVRDRGAADDPDGPAGRGRTYWPEVARLLDASYRSLRTALDAAPPEAPMDADAATPANAYRFVTRWLVPAGREEVAEILADAPALARWWPSVYLRVTELEPGDERGLGKVVDLWTKGWLPYTLPLALPGHRERSAGRLRARGNGRLRRPGRLAAFGGGAACRTRGSLDDRRVRLADPRRKGPPATPVVHPAPGVRGEPPLGDGPRRGEPAARDRATAREARSRAGGRDPAAARPDVPATMAKRTPGLSRGSRRALQLS